MDQKRSTSVHAAIACLQRLTEVFQQRRVQLAMSVGLSEQQWAVLEQVSSEHFMPSMFAKSRESSAAAVSKILRQLVDKGHVTARVDAIDARQRRYELTAQGKKTMATLRKNRERAIESVWMPLPTRDLEHFTEFGTRLTESLEKYTNQGD
jgi:DNA-binding MarR family transcriptional regulator